MTNPQFGQAWFPFHNSMLITPDYFFCHLSRDGCEADCPVVSWILFLALFEDGNNIGFSLITGHLPWLFKDDGEWFSNKISGGL